MSLAVQRLQREQIWWNTLSSKTCSPKPHFHPMFDPFHPVTHLSCERVVYRHGAILIIVRECSGFIPRRFRSHGS